MLFISYVLRRAHKKMKTIKKSSLGTQKRIRVNPKKYLQFAFNKKIYISINAEFAINFVYLNKKK